MNKNKRILKQVLRLGGFAGALTSALVANAIDISTNVTVSSNGENTNYLNQNLTILESGSLTYSDYVPSQTESISITNNGKLTFNVSKDKTQTLVTNNAILTLNGSKGFTKTGAGILQTLSNNYRIVFAYDSGAVIAIDEGTFRNGEWLQQDWTNNKADMKLNGTLDLWDGGNGNAAGVMIDALDGTGTVTAKANNNPGLFVVGVDNGSGEFSGTITESATSISIEKRGSGVQILSGNNTYSGKTTVSAGTLQIGNGGESGALGTGNVAVANNANLTFKFDANHFYSSDAAIANSGTVRIESGAVVLANLANTETGSVAVSSGAAYSILNRSALNNVAVDDGGILLLRASETDETAWTTAQIATERSKDAGIFYGAYAGTGANVNADALLAGNGSLYLGGNGNFKFTTANSEFTNGLTIFSGVASLTENASMNVSNIITVAAAGTFAYDFGSGTTTDVANTIVGDGTLAIQSGTVRFTTSSPKSGSSFIQIANVSVADGATLLFTDTVAPRPAITSTIVAENGGKVRFESSSYSNIGHDNNHSLANTASGRLVLAGEGTFEFAGGGTTAILPGSASARASISLSKGGWMDVVEGSNLIFGGYSANIAWTDNYGSLNIEKAESRVSLWDGNQISIDNLTGSGIIESGAIKLGVANNENSAKYGVANNTAEFSGIIRDNIVNNAARSASLVKVGTGTQILSGNNTYSGATTVSAGTLQIGNGGESGSLGTGAVEVQSGAVLQFNKSAESTLSSNTVISGNATIRNMKSTLNIGSADAPYAFSTTNARFTADSDAAIRFHLADGAQKTGDVFNGGGTVSFSGNTALDASYAIFNMSEGGRVVFDGGSVAAPIYSNFGVLDITNDTVWNIAEQAATWSKTVYTNGNGYITPLTAYASSKYLGEGKNVDDLINNTSNDSVRENGLGNNSAASYRAYVALTEETAFDFTGSYDDYAGIFAMKIMDENGVLLENPEWQSLLNYGGKTNRVTSTGVVLSPGYYLFDARVADVGGEAFANNASILDPTGKQLGLGIRLNKGSLTGNNYYSLTIDENGFVGDQSLGLSAGIGRELVMGTQNFNIADGSTLTINNPNAADSVAITANVTGSGTLALKNTSGENSLYILSGSSAGALDLGDDITLKLSKDAKFELTGDYSQGNVNFLVDLTGITEDFGWFTNVSGAEGLTENTTFTFTTSDDQMLPIELTFFNDTGLTNEQWKQMVDFSQVDGILNAANLFVDQNGMLHLTVGDATSLPEPSSWILLGCGLAVLGLLNRKRKN